jgi:ribA/ribD-fused uncharacterized protein
MFSKAKQFNDDIVANKIINIEKNFDIRDENGNFKTKENEECYNLIMNFKEGQIDRTQIVNDKELSERWNKIMMTIKKLGREVKNYDDAVWSEKRAKVVLFGARLKFTQNEDLKQILLNTGDTLMCEASKYDKVWGCGLSEYDAKRTPPEKWPGLNLLGHVLDYLKNELRNNLVKKPKP